MSRTSYPPNPHPWDWGFRAPSECSICPLEFSTPLASRVGICIPKGKLKSWTSQQGKAKGWWSTAESTNKSSLILYSGDIIYQSEAEKTSSNDVVYGRSGSSGKMPKVQYILWYSDLLGHNLGMSMLTVRLALFYIIYRTCIVRYSTSTYMYIDSIFKSHTSLSSTSKTQNYHPAFSLILVHRFSGSSFLSGSGHAFSVKLLQRPWSSPDGAAQCCKRL